MTAESEERKKTSVAAALPADREQVRFRLLVTACAVLVVGFGLVALLSWILGLPLLVSFGSDKMPMAPSTAVLFVLHGVTVFLRTRLPHRGVYWAGLSFHAVGALFALMMTVLSYQDIHPEVERLGITILHTPGVTHDGHMSALSALCFLLASLSFLASLLSAPARYGLAVASSLLAGLLLLLGYLMVLGYLLSTPLLHRYTIPPALPTSLAFVALGFALFALAWPDARQSLWPPEPSRKTPVKFLWIFVILTAGLVTLAHTAYRGVEKNYRIEVERQLSAVASLKVAELVQWRKERRGDAEIIHNNTLFSHLVKRSLDNGQNKAAAEQLRAWLGQYPTLYEYDQIRLFDREGVPRMSIPAERPPASAAVLKTVPEVLQSLRITIVDFYRHDVDQRIYLTILIPICDSSNGGRVIGVVSLRVDPEKYLYPFILQWPTPSETAETLLVRREGNEVAYLTALKFQKNAALNFRQPLTRTDVPSVKTVLGRTGIVTGLDYRDEPVIADIRPVPDSPWFLIARMNTSEVFAGVRVYLWLTAGLVAALLFGTGAGLAFFWRRQNIAIYRERSKAADALRESEERQRQIIKFAEAGYFSLDREGRFQAVNPAWLWMHKYETAEEVIGQHYSLTQVATDPKSAHGNVELLLRGQRILSGESSRRCKDGSIGYHIFSASAIDKAGEIVGLEGFLIDITARKQAEGRLHLYGEIMKNMAEGINLIRFEDGIILYVNQEFEELFGYGPGELIGKNITIVNAPTDRTPKETKQEIITSLMETGEWHGEIENIKKDGTRFWCYANVALFNHPEYGRVIVSVHTDITKRKRAEAELLQAQTELEQRVWERTLELQKTHAQLLHAEKLAAIGRLSASIAHEFNNPLQGVMNVIKGVRRRATLSEEDTKLLELAITECYRMRDLIKSLQDFNRPTSDRMAPMDIHAAIDSILLLGKKEYNTKGILLKKDYAENMPLIKAVADQIKQVVLNLMNNAVDACGQGGTVIITTEAGQDQIIIRIQDTGAGIRPEDMEHIFEPFFSTKSAVKGTGLGLPVSYGIVKAHGGAIKVKSEVGKGTIFSVILPRKEGTRT